MPEFLEQLPADQLVWGAFKVVGVDDRGNTVSRRPKFIFVKYFPETVGAMKRGRAGGHKGAIKQIIDAHIDMEVPLVLFYCLYLASFDMAHSLCLQIEHASELTEESLITKLRAAGGAHAPTSYEFANYSS